MPCLVVLRGALWWVRVRSLRPTAALLRPTLHFGGAGGGSDVAVAAQKAGGSPGPRSRQERRGQNAHLCRDRAAASSPGAPFAALGWESSVLGRGQFSPICIQDSPPAPGLHPGPPGARALRASGVALLGASQALARDPELGRVCPTHRQGRTPMVDAERAALGCFCAPRGGESRREPGPRTGRARGGGGCEPCCSHLGPACSRRKHRGSGTRGKPAGTAWPLCQGFLRLALLL